MRNCFDCPMSYCGYSFGYSFEHGSLRHCHFYVKCDVLNATVVGGHRDLLFEINLDEAKMLSAGNHQSCLHKGKTNLSHALPGIFEGLHEYDDYFDESRANVLREIIGCHPCIVTNKQIQDYINMYHGRIVEQIKNVQKEREELDELRAKFRDANALIRSNYYEKDGLDNPHQL